MESAPPIRVMALHALLYCERLFYLEEVEELRVADASVWAGRTLHEELDEPGEVVNFTMESPTLGLRGRVDAVRRRNGSLHVVEHKRGRSRSGRDGGARPWPSDRIQALAYAILLEEHTGQSVPEARIRYHRDSKTVRVPVTDVARAEVAAVIERAHELRSSTERPEIAENENLCVRCSLAPVCLPEEARLAHTLATRGAERKALKPIRLFPADTERRSLHVVKHGARVGRSAERFAVTERGEKPTHVGVRDVSDIVLHGHAQITTQALRMCSNEQIPVHFLTASGAYVGVFRGGAGNVQRRLRQFRALDDEDFALDLARRLIGAKVELQLRHVLRSSRKDKALRERTRRYIECIRVGLQGSNRAESRDVLMGHEGAVARAYFGAVTELVSPSAGPMMRPAGRTRRPPTDRFNALLSFGYGLLYRDVLSAILRVGLDPALGVLHQPRSTAFPLVLDVMELFRVPIVDMAILGAVNRRSFAQDQHFAVTRTQVWLSDEGRKKMIEVYERRKHEEHRHPAIGYTLSYARMMELEARLLEKEWCGEPGLFARLRLR